MLKSKLKSNNEGFALIAVLFVVTIIMLIGAGILYLSFKDVQAARNLKEIISEYYKTRY